ncbi:MAG: disulfide bond formation protein DsbA [Acidimicrobiia bacterium]|nr:disulfide bond formation protein DsbA [Acidimicrobiia bacterium]
MPERDLTVVWQPISLLEKNQPSPDSEYYPPSRQSHGYLRVMEALRRSAEEASGTRAVSTIGADGTIDDPVFRFYWELGRRIHHDGEVFFDAAEVLTAVGLDPSPAEAFDQEVWDDEIRTRMNRGLDLTGTDVGTPLIAIDGQDGDRVALFGPVITRVPQGEPALRLWDCFVELACLPGFWEMKRTRTERPDFGPRP